MLAWSANEIPKIPDGAEHITERQQRELEGMIKPSIRSGSGKWTAGLAGLVAAGFYTGAIQVEASFRNQLPSLRPGRGISLQRLPGLSRQRPPAKILRLSRRHAGTSVVGIDDTSLLRLSNTIEGAMLRGRTSGVREVAKAIDDVFPAFNAGRSELIATTEMNFSMSRGSFIRAGSLGSKLKQWITVGDDRVSQVVCQPNEAGSNRGIPITSAFDHGEMMTPGHPRCRCSVAYFGATARQIQGGLSDEGRSRFIQALASAALTVGVIQVLTPDADGGRLGSETLPEVLEEAG